MSGSGFVRRFGGQLAGGEDAGLDVGRLMNGVGAAGRAWPIRSSLSAKSWAIYYSVTLAAEWPMRWDGRC
jgi:hypothetical protein